MSDKIPECEICGLTYYEDNKDDKFFITEQLAENYNSIRESKRCLDCRQEYGDTLWPDQI